MRRRDVGVKRVKDRSGNGAAAHPQPPHKQPPQHASRLPGLFFSPSSHLLLSPSTAALLPLCTALTFAATLLVYWLTAYPSITGGDSGELTITACNFGIAHPPGYPTYTIIAGITVRAAAAVASLLSLPPPSPAYVVNMMNAVLGSLCSAVLYRTTALLTDHPFAGFLTALGFSFSPTVWLYSIQGEVFALNNLCCAVMAYCTVRYYESESRLLAFAPSASAAPSPPASPTAAASHSPAVSSSSRARGYLASRALLFAYAGALVCGLAMTNQHTTVFYVLPCVLFVLASLHTCRLLSLTTVLTLTGLMAVGVSPYLYLPLRSLWKPMDAWGDQRSIAGFLTHFLRREYGTFQLAATDTSADPGMWSRLLVYARVTQEETLYCVPLLAVCGLFGLLRFGSRAVRLSVLVQLYGWLLYVLVFHKLANLDLRPLFLGVQARFWQQANLILCIWAACGLHFVVSLVLPVAAPDTPSASTAPSSPSPSQHSSWLQQSGRLLITVLSISYAAAQLGSHYHRLDHHESLSFLLKGRRVLSSFPESSIVLLNGDLNNNILKYPQQCEGVRPDLRLLSLQLMTWDWFVPVQGGNYGDVVFPGDRYHVNFPNSFSMRTFLQRNVKRHPVFLCGPWKDGDMSNVQSRNPDTCQTSRARRAAD